MFTGIIEQLGKVTKIVREGSNIHFTIEALFASELKIDQSVAHNGVCLTITALQDTTYQVTAIDETLQKTNLGDWEVGSVINLERSMIADGRIDGHIVQGHVDQTAMCTSVEDKGGSWIYTFQYDASKGNITVEKGSICVNGVSLTVVNSQIGQFSVAIIPYTYHHTNFQALKIGDKVNLEFDILGKYVVQIMNNWKIDQT